MIVAKAMHDSMLAMPSKQEQVIGAIVCPISIDVVNKFTSENGPTESLFHYQNRLQHTATGPSSGMSWFVNEGISPWADGAVWAPFGITDSFLGRIRMMLAKEWVGLSGTLGYFSLDFWGKHQSLAGFRQVLALLRGALETTVGCSNLAAAFLRVRMAGQIFAKKTGITLKGVMAPRPHITGLTKATCRKGRLLAATYTRHVVTSLYHYNTMTQGGQVKCR